MAGGPLLAAGKSAVLRRRRRPAVDTTRRSCFPLPEQAGKIFCRGKREIKRYQDEDKKMTTKKGEKCERKRKKEKLRKKNRRHKYQKKLKIKKIKAKTCIRGNSFCNMYINVCLYLFTGAALYALSSVLLISNKF